ncbi:acetyl-CoA C-acetyltransferase [Nakamurella sp.]|uniref:acetyl-CoA C-acetyltransferase n=1 Tax=Nakamurella sp. TaxID=1869182 RepID=UPI003783D790
MPQAVIVATARSPIGRAYKGSLKDLRADDLTATMVRAALDKVPELDPADLDDLILGCGMPGGEQGHNMARVVAVQLGYDHLPGVTLTRYCSSSLQTSRMAMHAIRAGEGDAFISAGVEMISRFGKGSSDSLPDTLNPRFAAARDRTAARSAAGVPVWHDPRADGDLPDVYLSMGQTAENLAQIEDVSRLEMDEFALRSQQRYEKAAADGFWARDITPVTLPDGTVVDHDDSPRAGTTAQALAALKPVFRPDGRVTAGNACPLNDGAAAVIITSDVKARELGLTPLARIVATGVSGLSPEIMGLGPVEATNRALRNAGMSIGDVDLAEINEAFAAQVIPSQRHLGIDEERLNVHGGAIALGHPYGMTGARITTTLINALQAHDRQIGLETMCVGGGMGMAMILERLS